MDVSELKKGFSEKSPIEVAGAIAFVAVAGFIAASLIGQGVWWILTPFHGYFHSSAAPITCPCGQEIIEAI